MKAKKATITVQIARLTGHPLIAETAPRYQPTGIETTVVTGVNGRYPDCGRVVPGAGVMKGIVFTLLQQLVTDEYGEDTWDALLDTAGVEGAYTSVATYPDEEMNKLVDAAAAALAIPHDDVLIWFGRNCIPLFVESFPHVFEDHSSARSLVLSLNDVIHPEVRKLFPGAYVPEFDFDDSDPKALSLSYTSKRRLCSFAEGLLLGAADHYGEQAAVIHTKCMKRGDETCLISCSFSPAT